MWNDKKLHPKLIQLKQKIHIPYSWVQRVFWIEKTCAPKLGLDKRRKTHKKLGLTCESQTSHILYIKFETESSTSNLQYRKKCHLHQIWNRNPQYEICNIDSHNEKNKNTQQSATSNLD